MVLYQLRTPEYVDAYLLNTGDYVVIGDGVGTIMVKAEFEAKYVPLGR